MKFKLKISKKRILRLILFAALIGVAFFIDVYFENHPGTLEELETENKEASGSDHGTIYLFSQVNSLNAKSPVQKNPGRKLFDHAHDKLLQKCHQLRNHQELKAPKTPLLFSYHHLVFRHYYVTFPDDEPPGS